MGVDADTVGVPTLLTAMVVLPAAMAVTRPVALTVATAGAALT